MITFFRTTLIAVSLLSSSAALAASSSSEPRACTMEAKLCPDGKTYVGRDSNNGCAFAPCPGASSAPSCEPYKCVDGTEIARCAEDGYVINYFAPPCMTHGGDAGPFKDVPANHANANAIAYVKAEAIVEGYADDTFKPDANINRAEFTKILVAAHIAANAGTPWEDSMCEYYVTSNTSPYADVDLSAWYGMPVCHANSWEWIGGYSDGTFRPASDINFAEAAKIIAKAFNIEATTTIPACESTDCSWYRPYVLMLEAHGAIPVSISSFDQKVTRGEMAEMIWRLKADVTYMPSLSYEDFTQAPSTPLEQVRVGMLFGNMRVASVTEHSVESHGRVELTGTYTHYEPAGDPYFELDARSKALIPFLDFKYDMRTTYDRVLRRARADDRVTLYPADDQDVPSFPAGTYGTATVVIMVLPQNDTARGGYHVDFIEVKNVNVKGKTGGKYY